MKQLRVLYAIRPLRIAFKLSVSLLVVKVAGDLVIWSTSGIRITFPRFTMSQQIAHHPLNPPILFPYPVERQARHLQDIYAFDKYNEKMMEVLNVRAYFVNKMYNSKPMRENPDEIDYFMLYSEAARIMDGVYAKVLRKMKESGSQIPEGINQRIRELSQYQLDNSKQRIIPSL